MAITYDYDALWNGRDDLPASDPNKNILAADFFDEWVAIQSAFAQAAPSASPTFTGTVTFDSDIAVVGNVTGANLNIANWDNAYTSVSTKEAGWDATKTTVDTGASSWDGTASVVTAGALDWDATYTTVTAKEATWDAKVEEAPADGSQYARSNGAWILVDASGGGVAVTTQNVTDWNTAYGWGDHATAGYLTSYTETDPTVPSHVKSITTTEKSNWNTAHGWGNHASAGYALSSNVPTNTGTGASGTWGISISGNAATATQATNATNANTATSATSAGSCTGNSATATTATNCSRSVVAGTNMSGGGALTANRTLSMVAEPSLTSVILGSFKLYDSGTNLYISYNGTNIVRITSTGAIIAEGDVTGSGSA